MEFMFCPLTLLSDVEIKDVKIINASKIIWVSTGPLASIKSKH
jgi:hypothetical protein